MELAKEKFGKANAEGKNSLLEADLKLFTAVAMGTPSVFLSGDPEQDDPSNAATWGTGRVISADRLIWLCTDSMAKKWVKQNAGINVVGARVDGDFDLSQASVPFALRFQRCSFGSPIGLIFAEINGLDLSGSHITGLFAGGTKIQRGVWLRSGFQSKGMISLKGASIDGDLDCTQAIFHSGGPGLTGFGSTTSMFEAISYCWMIPSMDRFR